MKRVFYIIAVLFALGWLTSCFVLNAGRGVHVLLLLAVICCLHAIILIPKNQKKYMLGNDLQERELHSESNIKKQQAA